ncbi:MAG: ArsA family ATPase [Deltaproteobacteria bacterium]|nr:ArsA family ATPase [Deltaproteobacteria bacterium]
MRIIFYAGKGGVGKTSVASATAVKTSEMGFKTILMSLDVAHSLSDIFDLKKGLMDHNQGKPVHVKKNLWIQELDIHEEIEKNWGEIHKYISFLLNTTGLDEVLAEELSVLPGMEEVSLLLYINKYFQENRFDVIILDCAPTGESLRFISIPTTLDWYIKKIYRMQKTVAKFIRPIAQRVYDVPVPGDDYFNAIEALFNRLNGVDRILTDPEITTVRLVTNPEKIVIKETQRAFMYFCLYKMNIDSIIINRILPEDVKVSYFKEWMVSQKHYIDTARELFSPVPVIMSKLFKGEILGYRMLKELAEHLYENTDPMEFLISEEPYRIYKEDGKYVLRIRLPFIKGEDVDLNKLSDELVIRVGGIKRQILLPRKVAAIKRVKAKYIDEYLFIYFEGD